MAQCRPSDFYSILHDLNKARKSTSASDLSDKHAETNAYGLADSTQHNVHLLLNYILI